MQKDAEVVRLSGLMGGARFAQRGVEPGPGEERNIRDVEAELEQIKRLVRQARAKVGRGQETFGVSIALGGKRREEIEGAKLQAAAGRAGQTSGKYARTGSGLEAREKLATDIASRNAEARIRAREEDSDEEAKALAIQEESAGLLARVVPEGTISADEVSYNLSLVPRLREEVGENPVGRPERSDTGGRYPPTGWVLENPDSVKHNNINPGGRVNIVSRKGNLFRVNTGQGGSGITSMTQSALEKVLREGKLNLSMGEARERPPNLYKKFHGAKFAD